MSVSVGPKVISDSLTFAIDAGSAKCISGVGNANFTNAKQLVKNLMNTTQSLTLPDISLKLANTDYYTVVAIDYPESSNGGTFAGRSGVTPGFRVTSGTKTYDSSRALHLWVWNKDTNSWIADSYFNGYRMYGHCYDTYAGADAPGGYSAELTKFANDFNNIKTSFPNCTYIVMGSHRDSYRNSTVRAILYDLGMPTGTALDSDYIGAPEWILVGKPGLGAGNAYAWVYENNDSNSAYAVVGLTNIGTGGNSFVFDAAGKRIDTPITSFGNNATWEAWVNCSSDVSTYNMFMGRYLPYFGFYGGNSLFFSNNINGSQRTIQSATNLSTNTWYHAVFTTSYDGTNTTMRIYTNGVQTSAGIFAGAQGGDGSNYFSIGDGYNANWYRFSGKVGLVRVYSRNLSASEIQQNFNAMRGRFGI
jgi:hypothetical protein